MRSAALGALGLVVATFVGASGCSQQVMPASAPATANTDPPSASPPSTATAAAPKDGFKGVAKLDVRDSVPDWDPYAPKKAPDGAPNFLFVLYDDTGLAAWSP